MCSMRPTELPVLIDARKSSALSFLPRFRPHHNYSDLPRGRDKYGAALARQKVPRLVKSRLYCNRQRSSVHEQIRWWWRRTFNLAMAAHVATPAYLPTNPAAAAFATAIIATAALQIRGLPSLVLIEFGLHFVKKTKSPKWLACFTTRNNSRGVRVRIGQNSVLLFHFQQQSDGVVCLTFLQVRAQLRWRTWSTQIGGCPHILHCLFHPIMWLCIIISVFEEVVVAVNSFSSSSSSSLPSVAHALRTIL